MSAADMYMNGAQGMGAGMSQEEIHKEMSDRFKKSRATADVGLMTDKSRKQQMDMINEGLLLIAKAIWAVIMGVIAAIKRFFGLDSKEKKGQSMDIPKNPFANGSKVEDWDVLDGDSVDKAKNSQKTVGEEDILDGDFIRPVHETGALGTPTYLLQGKHGEDTLKKKATEMVLGMVYKQMEDPEVMARVNEMIDQGKTSELTTEIIGPAFEYFRDQSESLKRSISEELWDIVGEQVVDPIDRDAAINEIVESLPVINTHHSMLGQEIIGKVISHLQTKVKDIEELASYKAMTGASAGVLAGTFDPLREAQGASEAPHIQTDFKFHRKTKRGSEESLDVDDVSLNSTNRPRQ